MKKDRLYAKLIALSIIYAKEENLRQPFVERLTFRKGEYREVLKKIVDPQLRQWVESIQPLLNANSKKDLLSLN